MNNYHAILLDIEFLDSGFVNKWELLGKKHSRTNNWWQLKIEVPENRLKGLIQEGQKLLKEKFYFHAYRDNELIVVFPGRIFYLKPDRSDWDEMIDYGKEIGIPEEQLDMKPVRFNEESY